MPNKHDVRKNTLTCYMPRELAYKLSHAAEGKGITRTAYCLEVLTEAVKNVRLTKEEKEKVADEIKQAQLKRISKGTADNAGKPCACGGTCKGGKGK